jgi:hypothetical protein
MGGVKINRRVREKQQEYHYEVKIKLVQDVSARWNSTFDIVYKFLSKKVTLMSMALNIENKTIKLLFPDKTEFYYFRTFMYYVLLF